MAELTSPTTRRSKAPVLDEAAWAGATPARSPRQPMVQAAKGCSRCSLLLALLAAAMLVATAALLAASGDSAGGAFAGLLRHGTGGASEGLSPLPSAAEAPWYSDDLAASRVPGWWP